MRALGCAGVTLATPPFQHVKDKTSLERVNAQVERRGSERNLKRYTISRWNHGACVFYLCAVTILGQTWDLEAVYARDEWA